MRQYAMLGMRRIVVWFEPEAEAAHDPRPGEPKAPIWIEDDERRCVVDTYDMSILAAGVVGDLEMMRDLAAGREEFALG